ncbi:MBL fold metallo-hydrolase [Bacillus canaveralius]|uniref:MBL fold metallo-hydrolase n=1 Tax=Bacillus canaveralius TaxID=1403243 RepID=A0A2N5GRH8_9BACI|nr:MBL fold metallo-hydrolase [Bacillus canaveralius]PLR86048.1 MBL fold metallo-hydrolase [Bacillus canaveralius]PLS00167.1 MBL fold metallo-hydrolase [Bacillus canaveralius]
MIEWNNGIAVLTLLTPFPVGDVNIFLIKGERLTLIDVGPKTEAAWESFKSQLKELKLTPRDIEQVILTHHHPDHVGLLDFFPPSLEVYGHPLNERWLNRTDTFFEEHKEFFHRLFVEFAIPERFFPYIEAMKKTLKFSCNRSLTGTITEGDTPPGLDDWKVLNTPGHAQSHIALWRETDGVAIGGDLLLATISPNPLLEPPLPGETERPAPQLQYNASIKKLLNYPIQCMYAGHGPEIRNVAELVEKRLAKQHERAMLVKSWLEAAPLTVFEICQRLFPAVYERELTLTISETVAQLDYLRSLGEIDMMKDNKAYLYKA